MAQGNLTPLRIGRNAAREMVANITSVRKPPRGKGLIRYRKIVGRNASQVAEEVGLPPEKIFRTSVIAQKRFDKLMGAIATSN